MKLKLTHSHKRNQFPVVTKPPEPVALAWEPVVGIYDSASVSAAANVVEHPLPATDTTFAVSPDEPLFGENIPPG